jgi:ABC-2 type transport system permease protein
MLPSHVSRVWRAETMKLVKRPANWVLFATAVLLGLTFTYLIPYAGYAGGGTGPTSGRGLDSMLPDRIVGNSLGGLPVFLGAIVLILGVLQIGSEYGWGTWKTLLTQGPSRTALYAGKLLTLAAATLGIVLAVFVTGAAASALIASAESQPVDWPAAADLLRGIGAGWLIAMMWALLGGLLGIALRSVALPIGLGLVWLLAVQSLLAGIAAPLLDWVATLQKGLPGPNAGSLVAALGGSSDTPGVDSVVTGGSATLVIAAYVLGFAAIGAVLLRRRDLG